MNLNEVERVDRLVALFNGVRAGFLLDDRLRIKVFNISQGAAGTITMMRVTVDDKVCAMVGCSATGRIDVMRLSA